MEKESVIVIGENLNGDKVITCQVVTDELKLQKKMKQQYDCEDFMVLFSEDLPDLEDAMQEMYDAD